MEHTKKRYWRGLEELRNDEDFVKNAYQEFPSAPTNDLENIVDGTGTHRRDFLKVLGFGMAAVSLAACREAPVRKAIPYLNKPEHTFPSISDYYASTYVDGGDYASVLVETREGRPIKIEGNPQSGVTYGGTTARVQASVLSLYDIDKLKGPKRGDADIDWATADREIVNQLGSIASRGGAIRIVTSTILSPSTKAVVADFIRRYPTTTHVMYDANSAFGMVQANQTSFGRAVIPSYNFSRANTIVGINADFLGTWLNPLEFARPYAETRKLGKTKRDMSRHYQFEPAFTTTGANADYRGPYKPSQEGLVVAALYNKVAAKLGGSPISATAVDVPHLDKAATDLAASRGRALVVCGSNDPNVQVVVNALNGLLGSYGTTIDLNTPLNYRQGNDVEMNTFINDAKAGRIQGVLFYNANPVYDHPRGAELAEVLPRIALSVSFADRPDETASLVKYITPAPHYLESWNDAEPKAGFFSLTQPAITYIYKTRQMQSSLLTWAGLPNDFQDYVRNYWRANLYPRATGYSSFDDFWVKSLHDGVFEPGRAAAAVGGSGAAFAGNLATAATAIAQRYRAGTGMELALYEKVSVGTGAQANNPWLQEMPDPVTKACWDNYAAISQKTANDLGVEQNQLVSVQVEGRPAIELPVLIQPGQTDGTVAVAIGYGRQKAGRSANGVGQNAYPLASFVNGCLSFAAANVKIEKAGGRREIAQTQTHDTVMGRLAVLQEARLADYKKNPAAGAYIPKVVTSEGPVVADELSLWHGYGKPNHSWGMIIDLNSCIGCNACVIGCQSENNIAVVGRQEVINRREMHWLRIDRYYSSDADADDLKGLEVASANPEVTFQPMLCQHCSNAPCETVCPVLATTHSSEGLNQMTYNRCVGTRYCANNCPYKVRRFNWFKYFDESEFDYHFNNDLGKMVINPDVTVRSRGVIEKCSFCVQRIQEGKLTAKKERRRPLPDEIQTACAQACPTNAIIFGDMNNPESTISQVLAYEANERAFHVLKEINTRPQISYLRKIRNKDEELKKELTQDSQA
ncbi:TAT-variant-translocated molybdopterin oxidoreductase [Nibrella saemangeumensis]|uniref:TAT-variant-translocated molybdopterin oxidoreductase n=1 Tax=Nibrella saemangeumensis TaxID=1084526 RepID=A0ABP8NJS3_9BACT